MKHPENEFTREYLEPKDKLYRKLEFFGGIIGESLELKNKSATLKIKPSDKPGMIEYESSGLVVSFNGGGDVGTADPEYQDSIELARFIVEKGGIVMNGGRNSGIMETTGRAAKDYGVGIVFPEQVRDKKVNQHGKKLIVDHPNTRLTLLTNCPPITVVYPGETGTLHELVNSIVAEKNRQYGQIAPHILLHRFWQRGLNVLKNEGILPSKYYEKLSFFKNAEEAKASIEEISKGHV